jgi:hypothetical protein
VQSSGSAGPTSHKKEGGKRAGMDFVITPTAIETLVATQHNVQIYLLLRGKCFVTAIPMRKNGVYGRSGNSDFP